ncbi:hypothetical protein ABC795_14730 [Blastococcus sp. HT6-30]|uniref:hypothetical protein n=1 Tax=Blastococcus sp. HT6-30 TaxID=3144843 RepID=UPI00321B5BC6
MPAVDGRFPGFQIQNQNPLLTGYPGNLGGKTGFTDAARHAFVTAAERDGRRLVVSVLDTENVPLRTADQAARLLDWGFAVPTTSAGVGRLVRPADLVAPTTTATGTAPPTVPPGTAAAPASGSPVADGAGRPWTAVALAAVALAAVSATGRARHRAGRTPPVPAPGRRPPAPGSWRSRRR